MSTQNTDASEQLAALADDLEARAGAYAFLARAFSNDEASTAFLGSLAQGAPETGTALDAFVANLAGLDDEALEARRSELAAEHTSLLLGMSERFVSPYESVHVSNEHLLMQGARDDVARAYRESGFTKDETQHFPEDHVSLELDFCAALLARAAREVRSVAAGEANEGEGGTARALARAEHDMNAQTDFVRAHIITWVPGFCDLIESRARNDFYRGASQMLRAFLADEGAYLDELDAAGA